MSLPDEVGLVSIAPPPEFGVRPKRGAPRRNGPRTTTAIRLPDALHERLSVAATERDVSLNFLVTKAVEQFLDRLIPIDEMRWTRD
jgi:hypothetical protein